MSETPEIDSPVAELREKIDNSNDKTSDLAVADESSKESAKKEDPEKRKSQSLEERDGKEEDIDSTMTKEEESRARKEPTATSKKLDRNGAGECNLLPVLVEQLRSALEQSCSSQSSSSEESRIPPEDSGVGSEEDLRAWASGLCNSMDRRQKRDDSQSPRGLKLDLKFLEDLLLSDIQTALGRLQETLQRADIVTLTRYSSATLDPTNKLNLLKLISSLLANLKIPEESKTEPEKTASRSNASGTPRRRRTERHTIGVSAEELARARKWLRDRNSLSLNIAESSATNDEFAASLQPVESVGTNLENENNGREKRENSAAREDQTEQRADSQSRETRYDRVPEKYMKDALNQRQSLQNKNGRDNVVPMNVEESSGKNIAGVRPMSEISDRNEEAASSMNDEYGMTSATSCQYHRGNGQQSKCNKFLAKKSKIKRANTIDIPNYLKLRAESLANGSLRRPINIGDRYSNNAGNVVPAFEPKTENDRKFLALINRNNEATATAPPSTGLPFKSFNYSQTTSAADKNWNDRFSNIKTTFDKPRSSPDNSAPKATTEDPRKKWHNVGSPKCPRFGNEEKSGGFSHAATSPFRKIEKPGNADGTTSSFLKSGYIPKNGGTLLAKVKMFDREKNEDTTNSFPRQSTKPRPEKRFDAKKASNFIDSVTDSSEKSRPMENGRLNYHSFCKQFAPFTTKNPTEDHRSVPRSICNGNGSAKVAMETSRDKKGSRRFSEENGADERVQIGRRSSDRRRSNDDGEKYHRNKFYDNQEGFEIGNGTSDPRDIVAYPLEINYNKRPTFGHKYRDASLEKSDYEDPEDVRRSRGSNVFGTVKSIASSTRDPCPPPRGISSMQSVAVQTHRTEPVRSFQESAYPARPSAPVPSPDDFVNGRYGDTRQRSSSQRVADPSIQERRPPLYASHPTNYPPGLNDDYAKSPPEIAGLLAYPSREVIPSNLKYQREDNNDCARCDDVQHFPDYNERVFYRDNQNPIYVPPGRQSEKESYDQVPLPNFSASRTPEDNYNPEDIESSDLSENRSFVQDENIRNQDISPSEGVVTRYGCAIATVSPVHESPTISAPPTPPLPPPPVPPFPGQMFHDNPSMNDQARDGQFSYVSPAIHRDQESSLDEIRRHNLLQQNLIRQMRGGDGSEVGNPRTKLPRETLCGVADESSQNNFNYLTKSRTDRSLIPKMETRPFREPSHSKDLGLPSKLPPEEKNADSEPIIENNNTRDKISIFEGRSDGTRKHRRRFEHGVPRGDGFVVPEINVASPTRVFSETELPGNVSSVVDSSDEYLMSCANKPSRSIVLSKSESWHQLAMSKSTLRVPQARESVLLKPPKPKCPASLKLSKQYEASSSSDAIRKMEDKIQRYFQGSTSGGRNDSMMATPPRGNPRTKRDFDSRKSPGVLVRSRTMPHIYDESTDVETAFDSLFKETTRSDDRC